MRWPAGAPRERSACSACAGNGWRVAPRSARRVGRGCSVSDPDVLVLGSGIGGLMLALGAARWGSARGDEEAGRRGEHELRAGRDRGRVRRAGFVPRSRARHAVHRRGPVRSGGGAYGGGGGARAGARAGGTRRALQSHGARLRTRTRGRALPAAHRARKRFHRPRNRTRAARAGAQPSARTRAGESPGGRSAARLAPAEAGPQRQARSLLGRVRARSRQRADPADHGARDRARDR